VSCPPMFPQKKNRICIPSFLFFLSFHTHEEIIVYFSTRLPAGSFSFLKASTNQFFFCFAHCLDFCFYLAVDAREKRRKSG